MPIATLQRHLHDIAKSLEKSLPLEAYQVGRIVQNLRLDLPGERLPGSGEFRDRKGYPRGFPPGRGPNVVPKRERAFCDRLETHLPRLSGVMQEFNSADERRKKKLKDDYLEVLEDAWSPLEKAAMEDPCNSSNCCDRPEMPKQFRRYMDLRAFLMHVLFQQIDEIKVPDERHTIVKSLVAERRVPGKAWKKVAGWWHQVRAEIRAGTRDFVVKSKYPKDVTFFGQGALEVEETCLAPALSRAKVRHVVRELGLPGWETSHRQLTRLGSVVITMPSTGLRAWRPTVVDLLGSFSYFFLPGSPERPHGHTWCLTRDLRQNDLKQHRGQPEWVMTFPPAGIPCQQLSAAGQAEPTFQLVGLCLSQKHAELFAE